MKRFVVVPDLHGDHHDPATVSVIKQYISDYRPEYRICLGDVFDLRNLRKGCSQDEKAQDMRQDVEDGMRLLEEFQFTHITLGNHDQRLWDEARNNNGLIQEYCQMGVDKIEAVFRKYDTEWIPYEIDKHIEIGNAFFIHGFRANLHAAKATAEDFAQRDRTIFFGHTHSVSEYKSVSGCTAYNIGCACNLRPEYALRRPNTLRWEHCFAAGEIHDDGRVVTWVFRPSNGKWTCITQTKEYTS